MNRIKMKHSQNRVYKDVRTFIIDPHSTDQSEFRRIPHQQFDTFASQMKAKHAGQGQINASQDFDQGVYKFTYSWAPHA